MQMGQSIMNPKPPLSRGRPPAPGGAAGLRPHDPWDLDRGEGLSRPPPRGGGPGPFCWPWALDTDGMKVCLTSLATALPLGLPNAERPLPLHVRSIFSTEGAGSSRKSLSWGQKSLLRTQRCRSSTRRPVPLMVLFFSGVLMDLSDGNNGAIFIFFLFSLQKSFIVEGYIILYVQCVYLKSHSAESNFGFGSNQTRCSL